ncbi:MAG: ABC transporter ATP-binding protein [Acidobacteriota bacterium]|jgi:putative ABC transport system ATP-binding protein|nr:ABC transporter ATP-binding protein [Acidobacteriota bacterium]
MATPAPLVEVKGLSKEYAPGVAAVAGVDLALGAGEFACVTGRSGSGKSTLLNMVAGVLRPTSGAVLLDGLDLFGVSDREASLVRNAKIGYVSQGANLLGGLSVLDNVRLPFFLAAAGRSGDAAAKAAALLEQVGLGRFARTRTRPGEISGGEARRVAIARALVNDPSLVLADEPTGDLDPENAAAVMELFRQIAHQGVAVLLATHDPAAAALADRALRMEQGRLTECATRE